LQFDALLLNAGDVSQCPNGTKCLQKRMHAATGRITVVFVLTPEHSTAANKAAISNRSMIALFD
jgi:hypothetical protein